MRNTDLLKKATEALGLGSRAELQHVVNCRECELFPCYDSGPEFCKQFFRRFREPVPDRPKSALGQAIMDIWQQELVFQAAPIPVSLARSSR